MNLTGRFWGATADDAVAAWDVTIIVADHTNKLTEQELIAGYGGLPGAPID